MPTLECRHCGAPLPESAASGPVTCPYCQTVNEPTVAIPRPKTLSIADQEKAFKEAVKEELDQRLARQDAESHKDSHPSRKSSNDGDGFLASLKSALVSFAWIAFILGGALIWSYFEHPHQLALLYKQTVGGGLTPKDLANSQDHGIVTLKVSPPAEGWKAFDPGLDWPWVLSQAQAWAPDARLRLLQITRVRSDGTVDLQDDANAIVEAIFDSHEAQARSAATGAHSHAEVNTGLVIRLAHSKVQAQLKWGEAPEPLHPVCETIPLARLFTALQTAHRLPDTPLFTGRLTWNASHGWAWAFQSIATAQHTPSVRAVDGAIIR